jgi:hypothetical protein
MTTVSNTAYKNVVKFIKDSKLINNFNMYNEIKDKYLTPPYNSKKSIIIKYYIWDILKKKNINDSEKNNIIEIINRLKEDNTVGSKIILVYIIDSIKIFKINNSIQKKNILAIFNENVNLQEYITGIPTTVDSDNITNDNSTGNNYLDYKVGNIVKYTKNNKTGTIRRINGQNAIVSFNENMSGNKKIPIKDLEKSSSLTNVPIKTTNRMKDRFHSKKINKPNEITLSNTAPTLLPKVILNNTHKNNTKNIRSNKSNVNNRVLRKIPNSTKLQSHIVGKNIDLNNSRKNNANNIIYSNTFSDKNNSSSFASNALSNKGNSSSLASNAHSSKGNASSLASLAKTALSSKGNASSLASLASSAFSGKGNASPLASLASSAFSSKGNTSPLASFASSALSTKGADSSLSTLSSKNNSGSIPKTSSSSNSNSK